MKTPSKSVPLRIAFCALLLSTTSTQAQNGVDPWSALDPASTFDGSVYAIVEDDAGHVYVGGYFTHVGDLAVNSLAMWDGSSWHSLGTGLGGNSQVLTLAVSGGRLYVGGQFQRAGGITLDDVAMWDGSEWSSLGDGIGRQWSINTIVHSIVPDRAGGVYVGGKFHTAGGIQSYSVAHWDGSEWSGLAGGMWGEVTNGDPRHTVLSLALGDDGRLYVAGNFTQAGSVEANRVAVWDGVAWAALGSGVEGVDPGGGGGGYAGVQALAYNEGNLYAAGNFTTAGGASARAIARWDGSEWSAMDAGLCGDVYLVDKLAVFRGEVYSSGTADCGAEPTARMTGVRWTGVNWASMDGGVRSGPLTAFAVVGDRLFIGSDAAFEAGSNEYSGIAIWSGGTPTGLKTGEMSVPESIELKMIDVYPNPFRDAVTVRVKSGRDGQLILYGSDLSGRQLLRQSVTVAGGSATFSWRPSRNLPRGHYVLSARLVSGTARSQTPSVLVAKQ